MEIPSFIPHPKNSHHTISYQQHYSHMSKLQMPTYIKAREKN